MNSEMEKDILKVLVTEEELKTRIAELGEALYKRYEGHRPLFLGVLKGSFIFMADLMRASQLMCDVECRQLLPERHRVQRPGADHP